LNRYRIATIDAIRTKQPAIETTKIKMKVFIEAAMALESSPDSTKRESAMESGKMSRLPFCIASFITLTIVECQHQFDFTKTDHILRNDDSQGIPIAIFKVRKSGRLLWRGE
jgi:hypothetical protein